METPNVPSCLSAAIGMAVRDLDAVSKDDRFVIHMERWFRPDTAYGKKTCYVCLAGSVIANSFKRDPNEQLEGGLEEEYGETWQKIFYALDEVRTGSIDFARRYWPDGWKLDTDGSEFDFEMPPYKPENHDEYVQKLLDLTKQLEAAGT